ncbi:hypothetical protein FB559_6815 [Actinoallomurus bryophytorum]|uniref:Uncharacterized protein n=1 Tax=Actinoallomurus bryophytorum TaxID=1490222 RepID=A0A543CVE5_9ACTN|nr:hypothetical protein FB559_6815 [Actinoallomurus bryophytorum]
MAGRAPLSGIPRGRGIVAPYQDEEATVFGLLKDA